MLSPTEAVAAERGATFKRVVRAAAAMQGIYDDARLAEATEVTRGTVIGWWRGAQPTPPRLRAIAGATGLSVDELIAFTYYEGPPPRLPESEEDEARRRADAAERAHRARAEAEASDEQPVPRETAGSDR